MRIPHFGIAVYDVRVYVCSTREQVAVAMTNLGVELEEHQADGAGASIEVVRGGVAWLVLAVFDGELNTLAHEASHVVDMILKRKAITGDVHTEVRAYLMGYVTSEAGKLLKGMKWPRRPKR